MLKIEIIALKDLHEHPANRKRFDAARLKELTASVKDKGILNPLLVRKNAKGYEVLAGARRMRAALGAGLAEVPCIVRELDDKAAIELLVIDNLQREDVHPLEEAEGYKLLHGKHKYTVEQLAAKVGKSVAYVYARLKLCELTGEAKKAFFNDRITAGHAILLARLKPEDQARALDVDEEALFEKEYTLFNEDGPTIKARSVRQFEEWIAKFVRFDVAKVDQMVFPETAAAVEDAKDDKVLQITHDHYVQEEAREGKTYCGRSWRRADGREDSKTCEYSELGVVVVGRGQGDAFRVCVKKDKCKVHWGQEIRAKAKRAKAPKAGSAFESDAWQKEEAKRKAEREREDAERARWKKAAPKIAEAVAAAVTKATAKADGLLGQIVVKGLLRFGQTNKAASAHVPPGATAEDLVRHAAFVVLYSELTDPWSAGRTMPARLKSLGLDAKKLLDEHAPAPMEEKPAKASKKKSAKRK